MIEHFTKDYFESTLPGLIVTTEVEHLSGRFLCTFDKGEYQYDLKITDEILIRVRSSIGLSGFSATTGEDSIRHWLILKGGRPLSNKISGRWTTREKGWETRLKNNLRKMWKLVEKSGYCSTCGQPRVIRKVEKKDKIFAFCDNCKSKWEEIGE